MQDSQPEPRQVIVVGVDPSITSFGVSDGERHQTFTTAPILGNDEEHSTQIRVHSLMIALGEYLDEYDVSAEVRLFIEGVQMRAPTHGGSHLFQMGFIVAGILTLSQQRTFEGKITDTYFVGHSTWMAALFGKQVADTALAKEAYKKYGVDIDHDRGLDKLDAWCVYRFGCGVRDGEWEFTARKRRKQSER